MKKVMTMALALAGLAAQAGVTWWAVPAMSGEAKLPDRDPADGEKGGVVRIVMAKEEYEPGSFVVVADSDLGKTSFELSDFRNERGQALPASALDLKFVKVWYQNGNAWWSYFGDSGVRLCPELLVNDEDLIRVDTEKKANYARLVEPDGRRHEHWLNPPRQMDKRIFKHYRFPSCFLPMEGSFRDAKTLQPVALGKGERKQFLLTVHATKDTPAGVYRGVIQVKSKGEKVKSAVCEIPVAVRVMDFVLPPPKAYVNHEQDFLVCSYNYLRLQHIMEENGGDRELAKRQLEAILRDQVAHGQTMHWVSGGIGADADFELDTMQKVGMRTDLVVGGVRVPNVGKLTVSNFVASAEKHAAYYDKKLGHHRMFIGYGDEPGCGWLMRSREVFDAYSRQGFKFIIASQNGIFWSNGYDWGWHNASKDPGEDDDAPRLWNQLGAETYCGWYAVQHTGPENPDFNRRQYGLAAYLGGYSAACNYAHHLGPYNDDADYYKPMVFAYGVSDGVLDTLQWEGFREGIDDIRYATEMTRLARTARDSRDFDVRRAGMKALQYLAGVNRASEPLETVRAEMTRHILALRAALGKNAPGPLFLPKNDRFVFGAAEKHPVGDSEKGGQHYAWSEAAADERLPKLLAEGRKREAAQALVSLATHGLGPNYAYYGNYGKLARDWKRIAEWTAGDTNFVLGVDAARFYAMGSGHLADIASARAALEKGLGDPKAPKDVRYEFSLALAALGAADDPKAAEAAVWKADAAFDAALAAKDRVAPIERAGCVLNAMNRESGVRALEALKRALYKKPYEKKVCRVRYSAKRIGGLATFEQVRKLCDTQAMDRPFGGQTEMFATDVATGDRGEVKAGALEAIPRLDVLCDDWGVHFLVRIPEPKAREIEAGTTNGGSLEGYLAPGADAPYFCLFQELKPNGASFFNTAYDGNGHRRIRKGDHQNYREDVAFEDDAVTIYFAFSWDLYPNRIPTNGARWDFELVDWGRKGSPSWNGVGNIHGRSTWGLLEFELDEAARARILRSRINQAVARFRGEGRIFEMHRGLLSQWQDAEIGDPEFFKAELKPIFDRLAAAAKTVKSELTDREVLEFAATYLDDFENLHFDIANRRAAYLQRNLTD